MYPKKLGIVFLLSTLCMIMACSKDTTSPSMVAVTQEQEPMHESSPPDSSSRSEETSTDVQHTDDAVAPTALTEDKIAKLGFNHVTKLELDGYYCDSIAVINTNEVIASISSNEVDDSRLIRVNLKTGEKSILLESNKDEDIINYSLHRSDDGALEWDAYNEKQSLYHTYRLDNDQQPILVNYSELSPDGKWVVDSTKAGAQGIWSTDQATGMSKQWTKGENDAQPLWLPDSSGFIFLHDTGENLGDGAGTLYELAKFDIGQQKVTILPFEAGFWGMIEWLEPGVSILAHNGFDDEVGLKIVNLSTSKEYQIVETSDFENLSSINIPEERHLFVSDSGSFNVYGSNGELLSETPWPTGFDEYTNKHIVEPSQTDEPASEFYYTGEEQGAHFGPSQLSYSPKGSHLSYLLGAIGESMDDRVEGTRIALANSDGSGTKLLTNNYARISNLQWSPDGAAIIALFTLEEDRKQYYIGMINL